MRKIFCPSNRLLGQAAAYLLRLHRMTQVLGLTKL
jgi:hypothetical protein